MKFFLKLSFSLKPDVNENHAKKKNERTLQHNSAGVKSPIIANIDSM